MYISDSEGLGCIGVIIAVKTMILQSDNDNEDIGLGDGWEYDYSMKWKAAIHMYYREDTKWKNSRQIYLYNG